MNIALIIGCARSGTSILGELIASHPDVKYIFEAHHIWEIAGLGENGSHRLTEENATPEVIKSVREWFASQQGPAVLTVEKNPRNTLRIPFIKTIFPEAKIIHIVRDGRDVACSMLHGIGGTEWRHLKPPMWESLTHEEPILRCAKAWRDITQIALDDLSTTPHLGLKYEDLVLSREETAPIILDYLGLKKHVNVVEFYSKIQNLTRDSYHAQNQKTWYRNDHTLRIGRWRENLGSKQQENVERILKDTLTRLGYMDIRKETSWYL